MTATTLYQDLGVAAKNRPDVDAARTERSASTETIDKDRLVLDLYAELSGPVLTSCASDRGRTEQTREAPETIDLDRPEPALHSTLVGPPRDLYAGLASPARSSSNGRGETAITASTETIDWDQPPEVIHT